MEREVDKKLSWPRPRLLKRASSFGLAALGILSFFSSQLEQVPNYVWITAGSSFLALIPLIPAVTWFYRATKVCVSRIKSYPALIRILDEKDREITESKRRIEALMPAEVEFLEIKNLLYNPATGAILLSIALSEVTALEIGTEIWVVDLSNEDAVMGEFEISDIRSSDCRAKPIRIDPVWSGWIREESKIEQQTPANYFALKPKEDRS